MKTSRKPDERDRQRGRELARKRKEAGLSQDQLAAMLSVSSRQYAKYERGETQMSMNVYEAALKILSRTGDLDGLAEGAVSYHPAPLVPKEALKQALKRMQTELALCIEIVDRL